MKVFINILPEIDKLLKDNFEYNEAIDSFNRGVVFICISDEIIKQCKDYQNVENNYILTVGLFNLGQGIELTLKGLLRLCGRNNDYDHSNKKLNDELIKYFNYDKDDEVKDSQLELLNSNLEIVEFVNNSREFVYSKSKTDSKGNRKYTVSGIVNNINTISEMINCYLGRNLFLFVTLLNTASPNNMIVKELVEKYVLYYKQIK